VSIRQIANRGKPRINFDAAGVNDEIVTPFPKLNSPHLHDVELAADRAIFTRLPLQPDYPVRKALDVMLFFAVRAVIEDEHRAFPPGKELLQAENFRRKRSIVSERIRSSDTESSTRRAGFTRSTSPRISFVVSPSSTSDGW